MGFRERFGEKIDTNYRKDVLMKNKILQKYMALLALLLITWEAFSQIYTPITWNFSSEQIAPNEYVLKMRANIDPGWHLYTQFLPADGGPVPTKFTFEKNAQVLFVDKVKEPKALKEFDPNFGMELAWFEKQVTFTQKVKITANTTLKGEVEYMVCDAEKCLPPDYKSFEFVLKFDEQEADIKQNVEAKGKDTLMISTTSLLDSVISEKTSDANSKTTSSNTHNFAYKHPSIDIKNPLQDCIIKADEVKNQSNWSIFFLGFIGGLLALLTPCVFPMIPLTVSFFTKDAASSKKGLFHAFLYGLFIFLVYLVLSIPFHLLDSIDPNILNTISTNTYLNVFFFVIFVVFAISFFGYFEITLPSSLTTKTDSASEAGGLVGIFFMALTLSLVSFSCTGPILGSLLAGSLSSDGGATQLSFGMSGFGLALALPFALFAAFPSWLNSLPKSGGWLNTVKVILGFIEIALAIKFLSNADLVEHWNLITYELFLGLWILVGLGLIAYLMGWIHFPHDSKNRKIGKVSWVLIGLSVLVVGYLARGFIYKESTKTFSSLSLLSGLAPPVGYSWIYPNHCPANLNCFHSYEEGLKYAKEVNKPIMLDFTGWACVNCRKMEENVWNQPEVFKILNEEYVLISLYVDDREKLPLDQQHEYLTQQGNKRKVKTVGDKWALFQTETFVNNSQPWYALISNDEKLLVSPVGYTPNVKEFAGYLRCGLEANKGR